VVQKNVQTFAKAGFMTQQKEFYQLQQSGAGASAPGVSSSFKTFGEVPSKTL
jgi:hypothetical protein